MLQNLFHKKKKFATVSYEEKGEETSKSEIPEGLMVKCDACGSILYTKELEKNLKVCKNCDHHFPLSAPERVAMIADEGSFEPFVKEKVVYDPLQFPGYREKVEAMQEKTGLVDAFVSGVCSIQGMPAVIGVMDSRFIMASMGSVVGDWITEAIEHAHRSRLPLILFTASGGARMQEGIFSLMQMAKTSAALARFQEDGGLYISVITHPTTGGVSASFAALGDINIAEKGALYGFTGRRVIEQTIRQKLPDGFQSAEFQLAHGQVDIVANRKELKALLGQLLDLHGIGERVDADVQRVGF